MISFKAKLIGETTIKRYNNEKYAYEDCPAYFIRFNKHSKTDLKSIETVSALWHPREKYAKNIAKNFCHEYQKKFNNAYNDNFFAITLQNNHFENIDPEKVLGMAEALKKRKTFYLDFLQVHPNYSFGVLRRKFKNVGSAIIESMKNMPRIKDIILVPNSFSIGFYKECGFEEKFGMMQYTSEKNRSFFKNLLNNIKLKDLLKKKPR